MRRCGPILVVLVALLGSTTTVRGAGLPADSSALEHLLDQWASAWSSKDVAKLLPLFTDDAIYEDVTFGVSNRGRAALRKFATDTFDAFANLNFALKSHQMDIGSHMSRMSRAVMK